MQAEILDIRWRLGPNIPELRKGGCCAALGGKVISVFGMRHPWGEMDTMYVYDPATDWWSRGTNGPMGQCYVQGTVCGPAFYSVGGRKGEVHSRCFRLDIKRGRYVWTEVASLNEARGWAPSVSIGSRIYVLGGARSAHGPTLSSVEMLDTADSKGKWQKVADIPGDSRGWLGAAAVKGKILVIGGIHFLTPQPQGAERKQLNEVLVFDPQTNQWQTKTPLPYRLSGMDCCVYEDRYIIVVGGQAETSDYTPEMQERWKKTERCESYYCPFVLVYDTQTDKWTIMPSLLPMPTNDIRAALIGKSLYSPGGENIEPATSNTTAWLRIGEIIESGDK